MDCAADQPAVEDDEAGAIGAASDDEAGAIGAADEEAGAIGVASEEDAEEDDAGAGASDEDAAAEDDDTAAELDAVFTGVVVGVPRLKIQMRPMITITATMMIIQVLRFMGLTLCWRKVDREE